MPTARNRLRPAVFALLAAVGAAHGQSLPNLIASGDTTESSTVLWTRASAPGTVHFEWSTDPALVSLVGMQSVNVDEADLPAKALVSDLLPATRYYYRATDANGASAEGTFVTAGQPGRRLGLRFGASGDWRGELAPYPAVANAPGMDLDLFVAIGDTIYADFPSPAVPVPQATTPAEFRAKHAEVYGERFGVNTLGDLRSVTAVLATIDDHEVTNDFAGGADVATDPRFTDAPGTLINQSVLYTTGLDAFVAYNPIEPLVWDGTGDPRFDGVPDLYRSRRYADDAAMFVLDARSFRDQGLPGVTDPTDLGQILAFLAAAFDPSRTMLGNAQFQRLAQDLLSAEQSGVTWKFVIVPEPIQNLGVVNASDRFEGYAAERSALLGFITQNQIRNVVFIAADIHGTVVNNLTFQIPPSTAQIPVPGAFEITTGSVAFDAPFGPTVAQIADAADLPGALPIDVYNVLPRDQQEAYIGQLIDAQIGPLGYDLVGLDGSTVNATLTDGAYTATNTYGWSMFEIDRVTQRLTVSTFGLTPYTEDQMLADPGAVIASQPFLVQRFEVVPDGFCVADLNRDGKLNFVDVSGFIDLFNDRDTGADLAEPFGVFNFFDLDAFLDFFGAGCP